MDSDERHDANDPGDLEALRADEAPAEPVIEVKPHVAALAAAKIVDGAHVGPLDCPDCTRGLVSRGVVKGVPDLICSRLVLGEPLRARRAGYVVACGVKG